jgi:hypothetical protein
MLDYAETASQITAESLPYNLLMNASPASKMKPSRRPIGPLLLLSAGLLQSTFASENVPYRPFAQWADVPNEGQFVAGAVYEQSDAYRTWAGGKHYDTAWREDGDFGTHINQGFVALQYGVTPKWAIDLNVGVTTVSWRFFDNGTEHSTTGLMDWSVGVRYQIFNEAEAGSPWVPTLTFRAGGVLPGSYDQAFPFAPGLHSAGIQPELLFRKHFGWVGLGGYGDALYRWNHTTGNDQYIIALGLFQQFKGLELDAGWRHLQTLSGKDIIINPDNTIVYPRDPRENYDAIEAGVNYTTAKRHFRYGAHIRKVLDGNNTDDKFWFGFSVDFPFGGKPAAAPPAPNSQ